MRIAVIGEGKGKAARYLQELAAQQGICLEQVPLEKGGVYDVVWPGRWQRKQKCPTAAHTLWWLMEKMLPVCLIVCRPRR